MKHDLLLIGFIRRCCAGKKIKQYSSKKYQSSECIVFPEIEWVS